MRRIVLTMALIASASPAFPRSVESAIRVLRAENNAAIARHDFEGMRRHYLPDYTLLPGSSGAPFTVEQTAQRIVPSFADRSFVTYVRSPSRIMVAAKGKRAAETGAWVGTWRKPDGVMRLSGIYQAMWLPTPGGWRLKNESFVSLACRGSRDCASVD